MVWATGKVAGGSVENRTPTMKSLEHVPRLPREVQNVAGFLIIFAASIVGYSGLGGWTVPAAAICLLTLTYFQRQRLLARAYGLGATDVAERAWFSSLLNAVCVAAAAYVFGVVLRLI